MLLCAVKTTIQQALGSVHQIVRVVQRSSVAACLALFPHRVNRVIGESLLNPNVCHRLSPPNAVHVLPLFHHLQTQFSCLVVRIDATTHSTARLQVIKARPKGRADWRRSEKSGLECYCGNELVLLACLAMGAFDEALIKCCVWILVGDRS